MDQQRPGERKIQMKKKGELVLEVGAEGGHLALYRYIDEAGHQRYYTNVNDALLHDLMVGEDLGPSEHVSGSVATLKEGFGLLDETCWARLYVLYVHPDIAAEVWEAVQTRLADDRELGDEKDWVLERWAELCGV